MSNNKQAFLINMDELFARIEFLQKLYNNQISFTYYDNQQTGQYITSEESLLLALCYIDGLAYLYFGITSKEKFVTILQKFSSNELFNQIHIKQLLNYFQKSPKRNEKFISFCKSLDNSILYSADELKNIIHLKSVWSEGEKSKFNKLIFNGSIASIIYEHMRCGFVHQLGGATTITFDATKYNNKPVSKIGFEEIFMALKSIFFSVRSTDPLELKGWSLNSQE